MAETRSDATGNTDDDWKIFEMLSQYAEMDIGDVDVTTSLRSEIAALQYKRDRLNEELADAKCQMRGREQRCLELQVETDQLREQAVRQNAVITSLKTRITELEDRERGLYASHGRNEITMQGLQRDARYAEERIKELEKKLRSAEGDLFDSETKKEDFIRRLALALDIDGSHLSTECLLHKASELNQETNRLRTKASSSCDALASMEIELRTCRDSYERCLSEKDVLQRQATTQLLELEHLRGAKESAEVQARVAERDLSDVRDKLASSTRTLGNISGNVAQQETAICQLLDELKSREEKIVRLQQDHRSVMESIAILLSTPIIETAIKERIRDLIADNKDKSSQIDAMREKLLQDSKALSHQINLNDQATKKIHLIEDEKTILETRLHKADTEINTYELSCEGLKRDKNAFMSFLERLARAMNMDEISQDIGVELHTESLLLRAEQLTRLEGDKLVDKTALVYQLQRKVRNLREQIQRKDLHLDLLRRKLSLVEDSAKTKCVLQHERDEANIRVKKLGKQVDRLQLQVTDGKTQVRDLNTQLAEATDYKITALERGRKIEELQKRLIESESLRTRYNRKLSLLKEQVRTTGDTIDQERHISEQSMALLRDELTRIKEQFSEVSRRDQQLSGFKSSVAKLLGAPLSMSDYELLARLQKLVDAHHDFTLVSRRYDDPVLRLTARSPTGGSRCTRTPDRSRYDDSGYTDPVADIIDDIDDDIYKCPSRAGL